MDKLFILGSAEDFFLVSEKFGGMNLDVRSCFDKDEAFQFIRNECIRSNQLVAVVFCDSSKDFQTVLCVDDVSKLAINVILCDTFEKSKFLEASFVSQSSSSDIGLFSLGLIQKTFDDVDNLRSILRNCEDLNENKLRHFVVRNQKIPANCNHLHHKVFPRKILRR
jgi:hypothetical protein